MDITAAGVAVVAAVVVAAEGAVVVVISTNSQNVSFDLITYPERNVSSLKLKQTEQMLQMHDLREAESLCKTAWRRQWLPFWYKCFYQRRIVHLPAPMFPCQQTLQEYRSCMVIPAPE